MIERFGKHWPVIVSHVLLAGLFGWLVTWGDGLFFQHERLGNYYDSLAAHILHGSFNVSRQSIVPEAFVRDGKSYGYFGMTPALFRIPLHLAIPYYDGKWSRLSMMIAAMVSLWIAYRLVSWDTDPPESAAAHGIVFAFLVSAGAGSTLIFLASRSFVYHEAIIWGSALSLLSGYFLYRYLLDGSTWILLAACASAFLAFFARPTAGAGAVLGCLVLGVVQLTRTLLRNARFTRALSRMIALREADRPIAHATIALVFVALTVANYLAINYAKFHTFDGVPVKYYLQYQMDPARMQLTQGRQFHLLNIPTCLIAYFGRVGILFSPHFPWVWMRPSAAILPGARIDINDWASSIPASMPALFAFCCIGLFILVKEKDDQRIRTLRLPVAALGAGSAVVLCTVGICERYLHDFYPFLVFGSAVAARYLLGLDKPRLVRIAAALWIVFAVAGLLFNTAFALENQRQIVWGVSSDKQAEFQRWTISVDRFFGVK